MKQHYTLEIIYAKCRPTFHHEFSLSRLKHDGYTIGVCSNSVRETVEVILKKTNLMPYIDFYFSNEDVSCPKPHPEIYRKAMKKAGIPAARTLVVEDNEHGVHAARESKAHILRVRNSYDVHYRTIINRIREIEGGADD